MARRYRRDKTERERLASAAIMTGVVARNISRCHMEARRPVGRRSLITTMILCRVVPILGLGPIACHDATDPNQAGRVIWQVAGPGWLITPSHDSARVFFGTMDHRVIALDRLSGKELWEASTGLGPGGATAGDNTLVVGDVVVLGDIDVYAFDRLTGEQRWVFRAGISDAAGTDRLSTDSETIFASSPYGRVYAIDAESGKQQWTTQIPGGEARTSTIDPVVSDGVVYVGVWHETHPLTGGLAALDAATGQILWVHDFVPRSPELDSYCLGGAVVYGSLVIASSADGRVYGLDRASGDVRWLAPAVDGFPYGDARGLALAGSIVITGSMGGTSVGLDAATGKILWSTPVSGSSLGRDMVADSDIAVFGPGEIVALDPKTGAILWRTGAGKQGGGYYGFPEIDGTSIYANRQDGFVALRAR